MEKNISIAVFGGSISSPEFGSFVAQNIWKSEIPNLVIFNYGIGGAGFAIGGSNTIPNQVKNALEVRRHDMYILWCSTNDYNNMIPYGEINYEVDCIENINSQSEGINYCINEIRKYDNQAKILLFTSLRYFSSFSNKIGNLFDSGYNPSSIHGGFDNKNLRFYVEKQIECCLNKNIEYLDLNSLCDFKVDNYQSYYQDDKLHLTPKGYEKVGVIQAKYIKNVSKKKNGK